MLLLLDHIEMINYVIQCLIEHMTVWTTNMYYYACLLIISFVLINHWHIKTTAKSSTNFGGVNNDKLDKSTMCCKFRPL